MVEISAMTGIIIGENYNQIFQILPVFFTGLFTISAVYLTLRYEERRYKLQGRKHIRDERKNAYKDLLSIAFQITAFQGKNDPMISNEFYRRTFDNLAELSLIGSPEVNSKFMEIKLQYQPLEGDNFYTFFTAISKELSPLMYNEMNYTNDERAKSWWQFW